MIVEFRTYTLHPGTVAQFEERWPAALAARTKVSPLAAFWHTEVGPLNRVIHVWPYKDMEERTRVRATKIEGWPPNTREFVGDQKSEIYLPAPFSPTIAWISPASKVRSTFFRACVAPKRLSSPLRTRRGAAVAAPPVFLSSLPCSVWLIDDSFVIAAHSSSPRLPYLIFGLKSS